MSESPLRVLRVIARLNLGGPAHQATLASGRRMAERGFETVLAHGNLAPGEESMADRVAAEGVREIVIDDLVQPVSPRRDLAARRALARAVRELRPQIVHTHTAKAGFLGRQAALAASRGPRGVPRPALVHTFHGHVLEGYFGPLRSGLYRGLERRLARRTQALIAVSEATAGDLARLGVAPRERLRVVPLGLDLDGFASPPAGARERVRAALGVRADEVLATYTGRIVPIKRLDVLLRGLAAARDQGARLRLAVIGDGEGRPELERLAGALGIAPEVSFLGYRRDLAELAAAADVAVLSSDNEGTPVSLIEAAAAGLPAVATAVGGVGEVVLDGETGLLCGAGDHEALGSALVAISGDPARRAQMGARAQARALERWGIERLLDELAGLYRELAAAPA